MHVRVLSGDVTCKHLCRSKMSPSENIATISLHRRTSRVFMRDQSHAAWTDRWLSTFALLPSIRFKPSVRRPRVPGGGGGPLRTAYRDAGRLLGLGAA